MNETEQKQSRKGLVILKTLLIPVFAYAIWMLLNYIVQFAAAFLISIQTAVENPALNPTELEKLANEAFFRHVSLLYLLTAAWLLLLFFLLQKKFRFSRMLEISTRKPDSVIAVSSLAIGIFVGVLFNALLNLLSSYMPEGWLEGNQESVDVFNNGSAFLMLLATVVAAPIVEELLFRGILYNALKKIIKTIPKRVTAPWRWCSILLSGLITSVLFGIYHGNILQAIYAGLLSCVMIWLYEISGSLKANILFHGAFNFSNVVTALMVHLLGWKGSAIAGGVVSVLLAVFLAQHCRRRNQLLDTYEVSGA